MADLVTVPMSHVRRLIRGVEQHGHDRREVFGSEPISPARLADDTPYPATAFGRLYQRAILLLNDESLGMVSVGAVPAGTFRMLCLSLIHCPDLRTAIVRAGEFLDICHGIVVKPSLQVIEEQVEVHMAMIDRLSSEDIEALENAASPARVRTTLFMWWKLLAWLADRPIALTTVRFRCPAPDRQEDWVAMFDCPVSFDAAQSSLVFDAPMLDYANVQTEQSLRAFLRLAPYGLMVDHYREQSVKERVLSLIGVDFTKPLPTAEEAARTLNMSTSSLRRQLKVEGTAYQMLKDDARRTAAIRYLSSSELTLVEIAAQLGFEETSAFHRAFRRWTGVTPRDFQQLIQQDSATRISTD